MKESKNVMVGTLEFSNQTSCKKFGFGPEAVEPEHTLAVDYYSRQASGTCY